MDRQMLIAEAEFVGYAAHHNLELIQKEPERICPGMQEGAEAYLVMIGKAAREEKKNTRRLGRMSLRNRLRNLVIQFYHKTSVR